MGKKNSKLKQETVESLTKDTYLIVDRGRIFLKAKRERDLYVLSEKQEEAMLMRDDDKSIKKWHQRLGHRNFKDLSRMTLQDLIASTEVNKDSEDPGRTQTPKKETEGEICDSDVERNGTPSEQHEEIQRELCTKDKRVARRPRRLLTSKRGRPRKIYNTSRES
ncbi:hypothetical protein RUM43_002880 [Polyplax serrata]|uniref:GAG-pre-integrase domain-containing protein n=1 Tax=Polyplax serrata TaxID=468196 RepID=A0AAN8RW93_POLSC